MLNDILIIAVIVYLWGATYETNRPYVRGLIAWGVYLIGASLMVIDGWMPSAFMFSFYRPYNWLMCMSSDIQGEKDGSFGPWKNVLDKEPSNMHLMEMVEKAYTHADKMIAMMEEANRNFRDELAESAYAHFGLDYVPIEPLVEPHEMREAWALNMMKLLVEKETADKKAEFLESGHLPVSRKVD